MFQALDTMPGYKHLLRELIRSQILHLVNQLSAIGEESFVVSAAKNEKDPHLIGSTEGLAYMQLFKKIKEDFPYFLQRKLGEPERHQASKEVENEQDLLTQDESTPATSVASRPNIPVQHSSDKVKNNSDLPHTQKQDRDFHLKCMNKEKECVSDIDNESGKKTLSVDEQTVVEDDTSDPPENLPEPSQHQMSVNKLEKDNNSVRDAPELEKESEQTFDIEIVTDETENTLEETFDTSGDISEAKVKDKAALDKTSDIPEEPVDSDFEESDFDLDEDDFDEMGEEEIFSQEIKDVKGKEKHSTKIDESQNNHIHEKNMQEQKCSFSCVQKPRYSNSQEKKCCLEENTEKLNARSPSSEKEIPLEQEQEDCDEIKVMQLGGSRVVQVYKYRNNVYYMRDTIKQQDLICKYCKKEGRSVKELWEHEGSHSRKFLCFKCGKDLEFLSKLRAHHTICFEVPQLVKDFFKTNPNCTPKRVMKPGNKTGYAMKKGPPFGFSTAKNTPATSAAEKTKANGDPLYRNTQKLLFKCELCLKKFKFRISLKKHTCKAEQTEPVNTRLSGSEKADVEKSPKRNKERNHTSETENSSKGKQTEGCFKENTDKATWSYKDLLKMKIENRTCPVPKCGRKFTTVGHTRDHLVMHSDEKPFNCLFCKKTFRYKKDVNYHCRTAHSNGYFTPQNVKDRESLKHSSNVNKTNAGSKKSASDKSYCRTPLKKKKKLSPRSDNRIKNYKCPYCEKRYFSNSHLSEHVINHTGVKNFKCSVCDVKLLRRCQFQRHKKECELENPGEICQMIRLNGRNKGSAAKKKCMFVENTDINNEDAKKENVAMETTVSLPEVDKDLAPEMKYEPNENSDVAISAVNNSE